MLLDRLPPWATTGVGSLPHRDPRAAAAHAVAAYDVPFCPQLPRLEGDMVAEWLGADPDRCGWSPQRDRERPPAWEALLDELDAAPPAHRVVKLQVTGPATLACALERERGGRPSRAAALSLAHELAGWLAANARGQVDALSARGLDTLLVVDEPALQLFGTRGIEQAWDPLRAVAPAWGLHLCCAVPWDVVERAQPDLLSFDLALAPLDRRAAEALRRLLARGGRIAWGVLAAHRDEGVAEAVGRLRAALARLGGEGVAQRSLLTASCGTGRLSLEREHAVAGALADVARDIGQRSEPAAEAAG
ncbi:hypothetical protein [Conexibacter sp. CPCC 206217]|uniref:hypothetical protein n=1 Tax=Conexibacter sp. CPCC 206217 TaxID=3064574 RepID=UPI0027171F08|nr:hypothetical protein [Conexibacter sp. CPCC 206217]MDO8212197.1 hypothetical protein [Conexibacter sp. CPCC 206217]